MFHKTPFIEFLLIASIFLNSTICIAFSNYYFVLTVKETENSLHIHAKYKGNDTFYQKKSNLVLNYLNIQIFFQSDKQLRVLIKSFQKRWEIPEKEPFPYDKTSNYIYDNTSALYKVEVEKSPFSFKVIRFSNNEVVFNTANFNFIYSNRYIEFSSILPTSNIFGLGERVHKLKLQFPGLYTIWNRDLPGVIDDGRAGAKNTHGAHPMYLMREKSGLFHIVYLRNSNGMDVLLDRNNETEIITYKLTGGVIDLKFFIGNEKSPEEVVKMYHQYLGGYFIQPFWSFGFHQCRWGYRDLSMIKKTLTNYHEYGMPLDTIWMDIDYMEDFKIFTIDENRYNMHDLNNLLETYQKRLVLILNPGVIIKTNYEAYTEGIKKDIFVKDQLNQPFIGCLWNKMIHNPDFMNQKTVSYWSDMLEDLHNKAKFSGIWLDMNEMSDFSDGKSSFGEGDCRLEHIDDSLTDFYSYVHENYYFGSSSDKCEYTSYDDFYLYNPGGAPLDTRTMCLNSKHVNDYTEFDVHNFNGFFESLVTYESMKKRLNVQQPFILSRSTAPGSGKYALHWTGDNVSTYEWMKLSIAGLINFNIFGIPNVGADICGFSGNSNEELCSRWMQIGTLYPFARSHNHIAFHDQDPFSFSGNIKQISMIVLKFRYSILKFLYSLFVRNHGVGTVMRPLFFEFPYEEENLNDYILDNQFLLGKELLVTPVLEADKNEIQPYFPDTNTIWYEIHSGKAYEGGKYNSLTNNLDETAPIFIRSGFSIYRQNVTNVVRTDDLDNVFSLSAAFELRSDVFFSKGQIMACDNYLDYNTLEKCINGDCLLDISFNLTKTGAETNLLISFNQKIGNYTYDSILVSGLELYGIFSVIDNANTIKLSTIGIKANEKYNDHKFATFERKGFIIQVNFKESVPVTRNDTLLLNFLFE